VLAGAGTAGKEEDPMILVSVMGTVQYGQLEAKPPPDARPFCQSFVSLPPPRPPKLPTRTPGAHRVPEFPGSRRPWWCIILSLGYGLQVLGKDTANGSYFIVTDNYRLL